MKKICLRATLIAAVLTVVFSGSPLRAVPGIEITCPLGEAACVYTSSADTTGAVTVRVTTGSTSISCTGRCTYKAVYNGTILTVYGKGFTPYEVIEFRLNEVYLGRSDTADANGDVVTWFKRRIPSGTYELYAHEAHTAKNSNILTFIVTASEPQTTTASSTGPSSLTTPSTVVEPTGTVVGDHSLAGVVVAAIAAMMVTVILVRRRTTSNRIK